MTIKEISNLSDRIRYVNQKLINIKNENSYRLYSDEGGMMGVPSFFLVRSSVQSAKIPEYHTYECDSSGSWIKQYIGRCIEFWRLAGNGDYIKTFKVKVIN